MRNKFKKLKKLATKAHRRKELCLNKSFRQYSIVASPNCLLLSLWLILIFNAIPACAMSEIESIIKVNLCADCHSFDQNKLKSGKKRAPDLFFAGDKLQEGWLVDFLISPEIIRPSGYITDPGYLKGKPELKSHVRLTKQDALLMSKYLLTLKSGFLEQVKIDKQMQKARLFRAKNLFERQYGCIACHKAQNLMGVVKGGVSGPILSNAGNRLRGQWIFNMLKNPALFEKKRRMPVYKLSDNENMMITSYLLSQLKENERK